MENAHSGFSEAPITAMGLGRNNASSPRWLIDIYLLWVLSTNEADFLHFSMIFAACSRKSMFAGNYL